MLLTMEEIKAQLRLDEDFDADDRHLQLLACAAQKRTETYLNRPSCGNTRISEPRQTLYLG